MHDLNQTVMWDKVRFNSMPIKFTADTHYVTQMNKINEKVSRKIEIG